MSLEIEIDGNDYVVKRGVKILARYSRVEWGGLVSVTMAEAFKKGYDMGHLEGYGRGVEDLMDDGR